MLAQAAPRADRRRGGRGLAPTLFAIWFAGISIPLASLAAQHGLPFARRRRVRGTSSPATATARGRWPIGWPGAACRPPPKRSGSSGPMTPAGVRRSSGPATQCAPRRPNDVTARFGVVGAPFLIAYDADGVERYAGGYARRQPRAAADVQVEAIMAGVLAGTPPPPFPAYGCIVGETLRRQADPGHLTYAAGAGS
jgi:hypothetical protein